MEQQIWSSKSPRVSTPRVVYLTEEPKVSKVSFTKSEVHQVSLGTSGNNSDVCGNLRRITQIEI